MADPALALGLNTHAGHVTYAAVAEAFGMDSITSTRRCPDRGTPDRPTARPTPVERAVDAWLDHLDVERGCPATPSPRTAATCAVDDLPHVAGRRAARRTSAEPTSPSSSPA